jgi:UDP-perosamine 4-acetyltransferase
VTAVDRVVVLGAGGHAVVCIDSLLEAGLDVVGTVAPVAPDRELQVPHLGDDTVLDDLLADGVRRAFVAVGDNRARGAVMAEVAGRGFALANALSPHAHVAQTARLGTNVAVMAGAVVNAYAWLADGAIINTGATVDHDVRLGRCSHVAPGGHLAGNVELADGAFLGVGTNVIPGVRIGAWSQLGAGAVVVADVPDHVLAVGVPARPVGTTP